MSEKHITTTAYGDVEIETRMCASCGQQYLPKDMTALYTGNVKEITEYSSFTSLQFQPAPREVYFCESCTDQPISYILPQKFRIRYRQFILGLLIGLVVGAVLL